jgi:hypothetical protein
MTDHNESMEVARHANSWLADAAVDAICRLGVESVQVVDLDPTARTLLDEALDRLRLLFAEARGERLLSPLLTGNRLIMPTTVGDLACATHDAVGTLGVEKIWTDKVSPEVRAHYDDAVRMLRDLYRELKGDDLPDLAVTEPPWE